MQRNQQFFLQFYAVFLFSLTWACARQFVLYFPFGRKEIPLGVIKHLLNSTISKLTRNGGYYMCSCICYQFFLPALHNRHKSLRRLGTRCVLYAIGRFFGGFFFSRLFIGQLLHINPFGYG